jgi:hypothetical protein
MHYFQTVFQSIELGWSGSFYAAFPGIRKRLSFSGT